MFLLHFTMLEILTSTTWNKQHRSASAREKTLLPTQAQTQRQAMWKAFILYEIQGVKTVFYVIGWEWMDSCKWQRNSRGRKLQVIFTAGVRNGASESQKQSAGLLETCGHQQQAMSQHQWRETNILRKSWSKSSILTWEPGTQAFSSQRQNNKLLC